MNTNLFNRRAHACLLAIVVSLTLSGCGSDGPELIPAGGIVMYQDRPLAGAKVTFIPQGDGSIAMATTNSEGKFELKTGVESGVIAGTSGVTVIMMDSGGESALSPDMTPEDMQMMAMKGELDEALAEQEKSLINERYASAGTSGLTFEVRKGEENHFTITVTD